MLLTTAMSGMGGGAPGGENPLIISSFHHAVLEQAIVIFFALVLLAVTWNSLRSLQYRRALASGQAWPPPAPVLAPEPAGRRVLRIGFGVLWVFDGLLQLQQQMPTSLASQVLQPSTAGSPGWVQHVVGFGVTVWTNHPVEAAASAVWVQVGIGALLLVAPRGRWSRVAGCTSVGWALVVWAFGESFGGIFAPGATVLFGAPGAVLVYAIGGALVALPDRAWADRRLGRLVTGGAGVFLLGMAVLQAWPGRGFWQGGTVTRPGTLAGMVAQMAATPQPHVLASAVTSFASFDRAHGWGVNLFVVVVLAGTGLALLSGRRPLLRPTVAVLVVLGLACWVLIEDFGFWGGVGTDPNSMLPMLLLVTAGAVAVIRVPAPVAAPTPQPVSADAPAQTWWARVDSGYAGRLALALAAVFAVLVGAVPMASASIDRNADLLLTEATDGPPAVISGRAPDFHLVDQHNRPVSLADLRGDTVALTFLDPVCTTDCPLIAQEFRAADKLLGSVRSKVKFVAIAANPDYHSVALLNAFDRQEGMDSQSNWLYLTGSTAQLAAVLNAYSVPIEVTPAGGMVAHADTAYVIDAHGLARRFIDDDPGSGSADASSFSSLLASEIIQVMHS